MKFVVTIPEIEKLLRNHYELPQGTQIVISRPRPRKAKSEIFTLTPVKKLSDENRRFVNLIQSLIDGGSKIEAIKQYRGFVRNGLKEAKDCVENWDITLKEINATGLIPAYIQLGP